MKTRHLFYCVVVVVILVTLPQGAGIFARRAQAQGPVTFLEHTIADEFNAAQSVYAADVDGDGDVDVLSAGGNSIAWWDNDGSESFTQRTITDDFSVAQSVFATDVDGDGDVDVLGAAYLADDITWWENDGNENFAQHTIADNFNHAFSVYAADVDDDGDVDVLGSGSWWENDGSQNFTEHIVANLAGARSVYATDVDDDGDVDVLGSVYWADSITWWENDGSQNFTQHTIADSFDGVRSVYATDVDSDGDVDVLGAAWRADGIAWWENDGSQNFTEHPVADDFEGARSVYATDLDGDGDVDVLGAAWRADGIAWWENDGSQNFVEHIFVGSFSGARSAYATDVDDDGDVDILGAAYLADDITWWENTGGTSSDLAYLPLILKNYTPGFQPPPPSNDPPDTPSNPLPSSGATNRCMKVDLSWTGGDPDGDSVTYDVYFEANDSTPDALISDDQSGTFYDLDMLAPNTHYYWQIVARDEHGATTAGPVWDFITEVAVDLAVVFDKSGSMEFDTLCYGCWRPIAGSSYPDGELAYMPFPYDYFIYDPGGDWPPDDGFCAEADYYRREYSGNWYNYIVIEAEHYSFNNSVWDRDYAVQGLAHWTLQRNTEASSWDYVGSVNSSSVDEYGGYMKVTPYYYSTYEEGATDFSGEHGIMGNTPRLEYDFHTPPGSGTEGGSGNYYINLRAQGGGDPGGYTPDVDPRTVHWAVMDGSTPIDAGTETVSYYGIAYDGARGDRWRWNEIGPIYLSGDHDYTLNLWAGGLGFCLDKIVITKDSSCGTRACDRNSGKGPDQTQGRTRQACNPCDPRYGQNIPAGTISWDPDGCNTSHDDLWDDEQSIRAAKEAVKGFVERLDPEMDQVAYVYYSSTSTGDTDIGSQLYCQRRLGDNCEDFGEVLNAIEETQAGGSTAMADGMYLGIETLRDDFSAHQCQTQDKPCGRPGATKLMILMTDGVANAYTSSWCSGATSDLWPEGGMAQDCVIYQALRARDNGIIIYPVSLGMEVDFAIMQEVADITEGEHFQAVDTEALGAVFDYILGPWSSACDAYPIAIHEPTLEDWGENERRDIWNGFGVGNFGWLRWPEDPSTNNSSYLEDCLRHPELSQADFDNAQDPTDHRLNTGDYVWANTGVSNSAGVRDALDDLIGKKIRVLVWDISGGIGSSGYYHIVGFAWIEITDYDLDPGWIGAIFRGWDETCTCR